MVHMLVVTAVAILGVEVLAREGAAGRGNRLRTKDRVVALNVGEGVCAHLIGRRERLADDLNVVTPTLEQALLVAVAVKIVIIVPAVEKIHARNAGDIEADVTGNTPVKGAIPRALPAVVTPGAVAQDSVPNECLGDEAIALPRGDEHHD